MKTKLLSLLFALSLLLCQATGMAMTTPPDSNGGLVEPNAPVVAVASANSLKVSWGSMNADGYELVRSRSADGTYTVIASTAKSTTSYTDPRLEPGLTYYYKVRAYKNVQTKNSPTIRKMYTLYSPAASATIPPASLGKPTLSLSSSDTSSISVSWTAVTGATGYELYRNDNLISTTSSARVTDSGMGKGTYSYKVRAYRTIGSTKVYGDFSETKSITLSNQVQRQEGFNRA